MALKNAFRATLTIGGVDYGEWDAATGGAQDTAETKYTPFDGEERTYLGKKTTDNVTLEKDYVPSEIASQFAGRELRGLEGVATVLDRDSDGNYQQNRPPYKGLIKKITWPDYDSDDAATIVKVSVELSVGKVTATGA